MMEIVALFQDFLLHMITSFFVTNLARCIPRLSSQSSEENPVKFQPADGSALVLFKSSCSLLNDFKIKEEFTKGTICSNIKTYCFVFISPVWGTLFSSSHSIKLGTKTAW